MAQHFVYREDMMEEKKILWRFLTIDEAFTGNFLMFNEWSCLREHLQLRCHVRDLSV